MALLQDWLYSIIALLFIKTKICTHTHTHTRNSILSKIIFLSAFLNRSFNDLLRIERGDHWSSIFQRRGGQNFWILILEFGICNFWEDALCVILDYLKTFQSIKKLGNDRSEVIYWSASPRPPNPMSVLYHGFDAHIIT